MKIKSKLIVGFGSLIVLIIIIGGTSYFFISDLDRIANEIGQEAQEAIDLEEIRVDFLLQYKELDDYIETQNPRDIELYEEKGLDIKQNFQEAKQLAELLGETENLLILDELEKEIEKIDKIDREIIQLVNEGKKQEAIDLQLYTLEPELEKVEELLKIEIHNEEAEFHAQLDSANEETREITYFLIGIVSFSVIFSLLISFFIFKSLSNPIIRLREGSEHLAKGEFAEVEVSGNDELTDLAKSFNNMSVNILQSKIIITENLESMKKQKNKLNDALAELKESELLKEEFASMVTHELKTPLTPIRGYCEMLKDESFGTLTKDQLDYVEKINSSAVLLQRLIGDVLDVQKLDMERMSFNKESFDVCNFLDRLKQDSSYLMKDKGIEFVVTDSVKTTLKTDQLRLIQILENLIRNSVDFVPLKDGKIEVGVKQENGKMIFHVKDNGIGIPKEKQQNIFKKFYQVDTSHTRKHGGTGLGLVICRGIINALGGEIWLDSELGKGTEFYFSIPTERKKITMMELPF